MVSEYTIRSIKDGILAVRSEVNILSRVLKMEHLLWHVMWIYYRKDKEWNSYCDMLSEWLIGDISGKESGGN